MRQQVKRLVFCALLTAIALTIFMIEAQLPALAPVPGIKLGLANIVTLVLLRRFRAGDALLVLCCRILLSALLFGQALSLLYSLAGGLLSLCVMAVAMGLLQKKALFLTGAMGGLTHNTGQLLTAWMITATDGVFAYLPFLVLSGVITGLFTGLCAGFLDKYLVSRLPS